MGKLTTLPLEHPIWFLKTHAKNFGDRIYFRQPITPDEFNLYTFARVQDEVSKLAGYLASAGLNPGDKVAIVSKNCAEWQIAEFAIWWAGMVSVPFYPTLKISELNSLIKHSEAKAVFLGKLDNPEVIDQGLTNEVKRLYFPYGPFIENGFWKKAVSHPPLVPSRERGMNELAVIVYTSGTTGGGKGVMHSFHNLSYLGTRFALDAGVEERERFFSFLPTAHVADRALNLLIPLITAGEVSFAYSAETFIDDMAKAKPTVWVAVPRIYEKLKEGVEKKIPPRILKTLLSVPILSSVLRKVILKKIGLHHTRYAVVGSAPTPKAVFDWFDKVGLELKHYYGMTENGCYSHRSKTGNERLVSCGTPLPGVEHKIGEDSEILVKSPSNFLGYYKDPEETARCMKDGFFHTGDQGSINADGSLTVTGRTKEIFKTSKGKYIVPNELEEQFGALPIFENICVVGAGLGQPVILASAPALTEAAFASQKAEIEKRLQTLNAELPNYSRVSHVLIFPESWTTSNGLMTPTLKLRRFNIEKFYQPILQTVSAKDSVCFVREAQKEGSDSRRVA